MCIITFMNRHIRKTLLILISITLLFSASCAKPVTAEESKQDKAYYEEKYADEPAPSADVQRVLDFLETCVGGQYLFGAQGDMITTEYVSKVYKMYESYFTEGRYDYFMEIAHNAEKNGYTFPADYAWDCSGLWWYMATELNLYEEWKDMTASDTYTRCCTPITKEELRPGDLVFIRDEEENIVHMGVVGVHGYIYEAAGSLIGVVKKRTVDHRRYDNIVNGGIEECSEWNVFGRPIIFE